MTAFLAAFTQACAGPKIGETFRDCAECPEMVIVPSGSFVMGDGNYAAEWPAHRVVIAEPFAVGRYEVTQAEWLAVMGTNPSRFVGNLNPVEDVDWDDAKEFVRLLSIKAAVEYRLLSEAEWEFAARAGTSTRFPWGESPSREHANYGAARYCCIGLAEGHDRWETTSPVGSFRPNAFGLHDMIGNVWEWTEDCSHQSYRGAPSDGSVWLTDGECEVRVRRGGSWINHPVDLRSASRWVGPGFRHGSTGLRVARTLTASPSPLPANQP
jgi:formylglycine-generating enzyme required for sulfatase activity